MIKLIVFDFGGVYFTYNSAKLKGELSRKLNLSTETIKKAWLVKLDEFEKGECNENDFWKAFLEATNRDYDIGKLHQIAIKQFKPIPETQKLINKLKQNYKIGMLSNQTNWIDEIDSKYDFLHQFDPLIISKNEGTKKPEEEIFKILIKRAGCKPEEIIFIDDMEEYGKTVRKFGIRFIHFENPSELEKALKKLGVKI